MIHSTTLTLVLAALTAVTSASFTNLTAADHQEILRDHNDYRNTEPAAEMPNVTWSESLASEAQAWTDQCHFAHQDESWGENIAAQSGNADSNQPAIKFMIDQWTAESRFNKDGSFSCCSSTSFTCCHLTQVIWSATTEVGCGLTFCPTLTTSNGEMTDASYLACYYNPPGNYPVYKCQNNECTFDWSPFKPAK